VNGEGAIVEPAIAADRRADGEDRVELGALLAQPRDAQFHRVEERLLQMKVVDRIRGDVELGIDDQVHALLVALAGQLQRLIDVEGDVPGGGQRSRRGGADEAVAVDILERQAGRRLIPDHQRHHSISVIISTPTRKHCTRTGPRPIGPKCSSR
jgi:hypothetical protein